jgi:hypothetical protein
MRTLEEAERSGKFRYIINVLSRDLLDSKDLGEVECFFRALMALRTERAKFRFFRTTSLLMRYLGHWLRRNWRGRCRCVIDWLCLYPSSAIALRLLLRLCRDRVEGETLYFAVAQRLSPEGLRLSEQLHLCRQWIRVERGTEAAVVARAVLQRHPDDAEARHLLWSALLLRDGEGHSLKNFAKKRLPQSPKTAKGRR